MHIKVVCPGCSATLTAPAEKAGLKTKCPKCGGAIQIPAATTSGTDATIAYRGAPAKQAANAASTAKPAAAAKPKAPANVGIDLDDLSKPDDLANMDFGGAGGDLNSLAASAGASASRPSSLARKPAKSGGKPPWLLIAAGGGGLLLVVLLGVAAAFMFGGDDQPPAATPVAAAPVAAAPTAVYSAPGPAPPPAPVAPSGPLSSTSSQVVAQQRLEAARRGDPSVTTSPVGVSGDVRSFEQSTFGPSMTPEQVIQQASDGIVLITVKGSGDADVGVATGFVIDASGLVATHYHVCSRARPAQAHFRDGSVHPIAGFRGHDRSHNLAIVELATRPATMKPLKLRMSENPPVGSGVISIGHPKGGKFTTFSIASGAVNSLETWNETPTELRKKLGFNYDTVWIVNSALLAEGSTPGPLLNMQGEVVGIAMKNVQIDDKDVAGAMHVDHLVTVRGQMKKAAIPLEQFVPDQPINKPIVIKTDRQGNPLAGENVPAGVDPKMRVGIPPATPATPAPPAALTTPATPEAPKTP